MCLAKSGSGGVLHDSISENLALNEVSDLSYQYSDKDILRLYEIWMKTGSARAHGLLKQLGVQPVSVGGARREH